MDYISTRDSNIHVSAAQAIAIGLSPDGGLFLPESLPVFTGDDLQAMQKMNYTTRTVEVLSRFLSDFTKQELEEYVACAYSYSKFPKNCAPVVSLPNANILELFRGPTCAFKDFALQLLPFLLTASLKKIGAKETAVILVATSGDTGKAALEGFADVENTKICVFYPKGGTSDIQRLQMITQSGANVMVFSATGNFDDAQNGVKTIFTDKTFIRECKEKGFLLSSANSINWGRLLPQIAYYFSAYADLCANGIIKCGEKINVTVPTGNFGNILAAYLAKRCGLPIEKFVCASNQNNVLTDFINTGTYNKNRDFHLTSSPSMDILISSNLERLLYLLSESDTEVSEYMKSLATVGSYTISQKLLTKLQAEFACGYADDQKTAWEIKSVYDRIGYLCDPHTAVAFYAYEQYLQKSNDYTPMLIVSTASPFKFADSVLTALGETPQGNSFAELKQLSELVSLPIPSALAALVNKPTRFSRTLVPSGMKAAITAWLSE